MFQVAFCTVMFRIQELRGRAESPGVSTRSPRRLSDVGRHNVHSAFLAVFL